MLESDVKALRREIKKYIDVADERVLRMMYGMLETDTQKDWWDELPMHVKEAVNEGLKQADKGQVISHNEFLKRNKKWLKK